MIETISFTLNGKSVRVEADGVVTGRAVLGSKSAPRTTSVIPMAASSTTHAS